MAFTSFCDVLGTLRWLQGCFYSCVLWAAPCRHICLGSHSTLALAWDVPGLQIPISHLKGSRLPLPGAQEAGWLGAAWGGFVARGRRELCSPERVNRKRRGRRLVQDKPLSRWFLASCGYLRQRSSTGFHLPRIQPIRSAASPILWVKINSDREARILCKCVWMEPGEFSHKAG